MVFAVGEYQGDSTELIYLRARFYNPQDGRFQSRDTWAGNYNSPQSLNRWNYTQSNPVNFTDPSGYCIGVLGGADTVLCAALIGGVTGAVAGGAIGAVAAGTVAGWIWDKALEGKCGCSESAQILSMPRANFVSQAAIQGAEWGAILGFIAGTGPAGTVAAAFVGEGMAGYGVITAAQKLRNNINDECAWIQFGASMSGLFLSAGGGIIANRTGTSTGQWVGWAARPGYSGPSQGWSNLKPSDLKPGYNGMSLQEAVAEGNYRPPSNIIGGSSNLRNTAKFIYAIDEQGNIWVTRNTGTFHHPDLVNGGNVYGAGEMYINQQGEIVSINNISGHYQPQGTTFFGYLGHLLGKIGIKVLPGALP